MRQINKNDHRGLSKLAESGSEEIEKYYDEWSGEYDRDLEKWRYQSPDEAAEILLSHLNPSAEIVDAGCGTGLTGKALARAGFSRIDGMDLSAKSVDAAKKLNIYRSLEQVDMQKLPLPFADNTYDGLECIGVLTYFPKSHDLLQEFCRIVRPGGVILLTQRTDIYKERKFSDTLNSLETDGVWEILKISAARPYIPDHEEYADKIMIHYISCRVL